MGPNEYKLIQMFLYLNFLSGHFEFVTVYLGLVCYTDCHVRLFWRSYPNTNWDFTRDIEEEKPIQKARDSLDDHLDIVKEAETEIWLSVVVVCRVVAFTCILQLNELHIALHTVMHTEL